MPGSRFLPLQGVSRPLQITLAIAVLSGLWALIILIVGGVNLSILGLRVRSTSGSDPAIVSIIAFAVFAWLRRPAVPRQRWWRTSAGWLLAAILILAAVARFWALTFGLPHPAARPDEEAIASMSNVYYWGEFKPTVFTYPPLFIMVVAAARWMVSQKIPAMLSRMNLHLSPFEISTAGERTIARVLSAAAGTMSVWLLFRIGARLFGRATALVAAVFLALAFLHVRDSHFGVTDIPMTCMMLVGFLAIVKLSESGSLPDLMAAGVLTGLAAATKYNAVLLVVPGAFAILNDPQQRPLSRRLLRGVLYGLLVVAAFLVICPHAVITYDVFLKDIRDVAQHLAIGHGPDLGRGWIYHITTTLRYGLGLPLLLAGVGGLAVMIRNEGRRGVLVALFPCAYYLLSGSGRTVFTRHALPLVPFLCLTAGYLVVRLAEALTRAPERARWRVPATLVLTLAVLWPSARSVITFDRLLAREDSRLVARRWIESRFPRGTTIAQLGPSNAHVYIDYETDYRLVEIDAGSTPTLVVIASSPMTFTGVDAVAPILARDYDLQFVRQVVGEDDRLNIYDQQDEFFVPLAGFHDVERPGPNLRIYVRRF